jgi:hypothetical protein
MTKIGNYWRQKPQLTGIPCDHLLAICSFRRLNYTQYVSPYYIIQYYINTWSGHWRSYDNRQDWSMYNDSIIRLDPAKFNKEKRRNIHIPIIMDEMEGRINIMPTRSSRAWFRLPVFLCFVSLYLSEQLDFNCCFNILNYLILFYNNILIVLIFDFVNLYFNFCYNILDQFINYCTLFSI